MMISTNRKSLALLLDPDKSDEKSLSHILKIAVSSGTDLILAGGSLTFNPINNLIDSIHQKCSIPVALFPGNLMQLTDRADYIFLLSLISGRNPELLIGNHVLAAPYLSKIRERVIPVGYILIGTGSNTSVVYMSQTEPVPANKPDIAVATSIAGELLGLKMIYLEAGSGAPEPVPAETIRAVRKNISIPIIVGGGLRSGSLIKSAYEAGADMIVLGNGAENNPDILEEACKIRDKMNGRPKTGVRSPESED